MPEGRVDIELVTRADTSGAQQTAAALQQVKTEAESAQRAAAGASVGFDRLSTVKRSLRAAARGLATELSGLGKWFGAAGSALFGPFALLATGVGMLAGHAVNTLRQIKQAYEAGLKATLREMPSDVHRAQRSLEEMGRAGRAALDQISEALDRQLEQIDSLHAHRARLQELELDIEETRARQEADEARRLEWLADIARRRAELSRKPVAEQLDALHKARAEIAEAERSEQEQIQQRIARLDTLIRQYGQAEQRARELHRAMIEAESRATEAQARPPTITRYAGFTAWQEPDWARVRQIADEARRARQEFLATEKERAALARQLEAVAPGVRDVTAAEQYVRGLAATAEELRQRRQEEIEQIERRIERLRREGAMLDQEARLRADLAAANLAAERAELQRRLGQQLDRTRGEIAQVGQRLIESQSQLRGALLMELRRLQTEQDKLAAELRRLKSGQ